MSSSITVYDGATSIGGNKIYLAFEGSGVFLDFGLNYKTMEHYFEEFLRPRQSRGIHDFILMDLVPKLNIYRNDMIPTDVDLTSAIDLKVDAVFLSHAHLDHTGYVGFLNTNIPIIATPMSAAIMKAMADCSSGLEYETVYTAPREFHREDSRLIKTTNWRSAPYLNRNLLISDEYPDAFTEFWDHCPRGREYHSGEIHPSSSLEFEFKCYEVDHSIYGAAACAINTPAGWVVYTGDLRTHGKFKAKTETFVRAAESLAPKLLITEGTRVDRPEPEEESEEDVYQTCLEATQAEEKLVIADFSPRNFERLDAFMEVTERTERTLVVLPKDAYLIDAMSCVDSSNRMDDLQIYKDLKSTRYKFENEVFEKFSDKLLDPTNITEAPESYIICFSFWDMKHLLDIRPDCGGTYIYSSSEAFSEEQVIDFRRLWNWLKYFNINVKGFKLIEENGRIIPKFESGYHASGHISPDELLRIINEISPEMIMPVHTENPDWFKNLPDYQVILPQNGVKIELS